MLLSYGMCSICARCGLITPPRVILDNAKTSPGYDDPCSKPWQLGYSSQIVFRKGVQQPRSQSCSYSSSISILYYTYIYIHTYIHIGRESDRYLDIEICMSVRISMICMHTIYISHARVHMRVRVHVHTYTDDIYAWSKY